jgi:hypothetical protein
MPRIISLPLPVNCHPSHLCLNEQQEDEVANSIKDLALMHVNYRD